MRIATPYGLAMTVVVVTWPRFAGGAAFFCGCTAERAMPVSYIVRAISPSFFLPLSDICGNINPETKREELIV
jgi:hypothetical protein